ncbi:MAG TPA: HU family DNA-binding protein [Pirellulaceae bacterium]|nr:HU family DNA-binding protein [Pirellulaceae bacterium]
MTKKEIVKTISEEIGMTQLVTKEIVQKTFDAIIETLVAEGRIELRNFGVFEVKKRKSRKARNPKTGDPVEVSEKFVVTFKPGKEMEERVRQHGSVAPAETPAVPENPPAALYRSPGPDSLSEPPSDGRTAPVSPIATGDSHPLRDGHPHRDGTLSADGSSLERRPETLYSASRGPS